MTEVVVEYLGALQAEQGASRNTLAAYRSDLLDFTEFLRRHRCALASLAPDRSEEHTSELQSHHDLVCRLLLEKKKKNKKTIHTNIIHILHLLLTLLFHIYYPRCTFI